MRRPERGSSWSWRRSTPLKGPSRIFAAGSPVRCSSATKRRPARRESRGKARGILAIGDVATGVIAVGGIARGVIAIGGLGFGLVTVAGVGFGALVIAGVALGQTSFGGVAVGHYAKGGVAIGGHIVSKDRTDHSAAVWFGLGQVSRWRGRKRVAAVRL